MTSETKGGAPVTAPLDAPTHPDPYNYYAQLHSAAPVQFDAALNAWVVSSAAAVTQMLENPVARVRPAAEPVPPGLLGSQAGLLFGHLVRMNDGPVHERLKCQVARCLDAVSDETLWEVAREAARQCATLTEPVRHPDGLTSFCYQLPAQTMGLLLGLPAAALPPRAVRLTSLLVRCISPVSSTADQFNASREAAGLLWQLFPRTHADYAYSIRASANICQLDADSVYLAVLPVAHNFPLSSPGILGVLHAGGRVVFAQGGDPEQAFDLIADERVTITALVPPLVLIWMEQAPALRPDLSSLRLLQVGGAKLSEEAARRVGPLLGCRLQQVFGMAEGLVCYTRAEDGDEAITTTQGQPISPAGEIRIVDDDVALPLGAVGNLLTRGPYTIRGYFNAPKHNARAFTSDGFYRTGDLARQLPSGHLVVEGRVKDLINRGGDKVAAEEVENLLLSHPAVLDVALVAMPDDFLGERSCAFVIARGAPPALAELRRFLRDCGVADFKLPDRLELLPSFAQTGVGKVSKKALREIIAAKLAAERDAAPLHATPAEPYAQHAQAVSRPPAASASSSPQVQS
ncbi:AMP-binding protein [Verminephrobacter aporrectodeae]|uniref:AMP-binding protein n=2 Tax=Verminephrobacter aporrectodeae TaxID=1110389 RepID=UPI002242ECB5|nr:AMP-binding protein [Verminephrobacter aporrectodeae]